MKGEVSLKKLGGQKRGGTWQRVRGYGKVGLPQDTRPGVSRLCSETNRGLHLLPSVLSRVYWALNRAQLSLPFHPPPSSTSRGEVCNVFDLMHSRNKVYCRVACVASWIHFSWASAPPHVRVFARAPLCAHRKTWLGLMKRARWLPPLFLSLSLSTLFRSSCHGNRESSLLDLHRNRRRPVTRSLTRLSLNSRDRSRDARQFIARRGSLPRVTITQGESNGWTCYRTMVEGCK